LGWLAWKKTKSVWVALLLQSAMFITTNTLDHAWTKISPEPFLFFIICIYVIVILYYYYEKDLNSWKYVILFALLAGAGLGTKATFLPVIFFPLIVIPGIKKKIIYLACIVPSFVLFTIPIIPEYENMYYWLKGLMSHKGIYGHGEKGFIDFSTYFPNILRIIKNNFLFAVVLFAAILTSLSALFSSLRKSKSISREKLFLTGLTVSSVLGVLMVAKHYHVNHYLIPVLQLTGITLFFIVNTTLHINPGRSIKKIVWPVITLALIIFLAWKQPPVIKYIEEGYRLTNEEMKATNEMIEKDYAEYTRIFYYPNSLNPYSALNFGDVYCKRQFLPNLNRLYPDILFYHAYQNKIQNWTTDIQLPELIGSKGNKILLSGALIGAEEVNAISGSGFPLENIYNGRIQRIFILDTLRYTRMNRISDNDMYELLFSDMEQVSNDKQFILADNNEKIGSAKLLTGERAQSGNASLKMDQNTVYAMEYLLTDLVPGDVYEVEIWRHDINNSGRLVVSSSDAKLFYRAQAEYTTPGENEWNKLSIRFTVTPELKGETLKVYLWNKDKKLVYFDDFSIRKSTVPVD
jgi:hypothetical protein